MADSVIVNGIDPGNRFMGLGAIELPKDGGSPRRLLSRTAELPKGHLERLEAIYKASFEFMQFVWTHHSTDRSVFLVVEEQFTGINPKSGLMVAEARGAALAAAPLWVHDACGVDPKTVKKLVAGHGDASKEDVQAAVKKALSLTFDPQEDEADALAICLTASFFQTKPDKK